VTRAAAIAHALASRPPAGAGLRLLQRSAGAAAAALPGAAQRDWRELANKLEAFVDFHQAATLLGPVAGFEPPLDEPLRRAVALGAHRSLWTIEGLGYARAESAWRAGRSPGPVLPPGIAERWPRAVVPLHTGAALSFAERLLGTAGGGSADGLALWLAGWEESAGADWRGIGAEALGLVARNLEPRLVPRLSDQLSVFDPLLAEHLWHGVGRGLYFAPAHAVPHTHGGRRAFAKARREPPGEEERRNATAGLAFALTLVNLRHPEVVAAALEGEAGTPGISSGVASALVLWSEMVGRDSHLTGFLSFRPSRPGLDAVWRDVVLAPATAALDAPPSHGVPAGLFRSAG